MAHQAPPTDAFRSPTIEVLVGPTEEAFYVHKILLVSRSPFFKAALTGGWKEAKDGIVRLPEADVQSFEWFVYYLYTGQLNLKAIEDSAFESAVELEKKEAAKANPSPEVHIDDFTTAVMRQKLILTYGISEMLQCDILQNLVMDAFIRSLSLEKHYLPDAGTVCLIFDSTQVHSPLRRLVVDSFVYKGHCDIFGPKNFQLPVFPLEFIHQILRKCFADRFVALRPGEAPFLQQDICKIYHEHRDRRYECPMPARNPAPTPIDNGST